MNFFREAVESGRERGGAFAVYHRGELVVNLWGGYADVEGGVPWRGDTLSQTFSSSKAVIGIVAAMLVERLVATKICCV